ncbi:outer membrane beta-barrel protein [Desulfatibacillum aliphaticivorans]|uniref:outer membrane beta-barrel protein n=1 Tax=Desulfatibacillum aliphaticivorans TaxID=218208 RepID=UPI0004147E74|nr:outer membrane beta-barrel protein [Desulfatibacillum aliphaticivorans]
MKKWILLFVLALGLLAPAGAWAGDLRDEEWPDEIRTGDFYYLGLGGQYAFDNFNIDDPYDLDYNTDNTFGAYLQAGYRYNKYLAAEFNFHWLPDFKVAGDTPSWKTSQYLELESSVNMYMLVAKLSPGLDSEVWKPYFIAGGGWAYGNHNLFASQVAQNTSKEQEGDWFTSSNSGGAAQAGLGVILFPGNQFSVQMESCYFWGFGDVDMVRYGNISIGLSFPL